MDERRTGWLLVVLLAAQLVALAIQAPAPDGRHNVLEAVGLRLLGPLARTIAGGASSVGQMDDNLKLRSTLVEENRRLRRRLEALQLEAMQLRDWKGKAVQLGEAVRYQPPPGSTIRVADVVYVDYTSWLRTLILYTGRGGARVNQPVITPRGLVGRVVLVSGPYAKVQLVTDRAAAVSGMTVRTRRQGVVRGGGSAGFQGTLELDYVPIQSDVRAGDTVVTAGIDGVFPRGIAIGRVLSVQPGDQLFHRIRLAPAVDFGTLDQVYLVDFEAVPEAVRRATPNERP